MKLGIWQPVPARREKQQEGGEKKQKQEDQQDLLNAVMTGYI
jgi:hypothetical protein